MLSDKEIEFIKGKLGFFNKLNKDEQRSITENVIKKSYAKGDALLSGIAECSGLIIVANGQLRAYYISEEGREITLYRLLEGDVCIMSASCAIKNITFNVNLEFETQSEIYLIPTRVWSGLSNSNIAVKQYEMELMASRFSEVMWVMEQLVFKGMGERVASFLMEQSALHQSDIIKITHEAMAKNLSTAREVVSRTLKHLENDGIIELSRGAVRILDFKKLKKII